MRRSELLGLRWPDIDFEHQRLSVNRGLLALGYELHASRGKTDNARQPINLGPTTIAVLRGWRALQSAEFSAVGCDECALRGTGSCADIG